MNPELLFTELLEALCAARAWISNEPHWLASSHFARPEKRNTDELRQRMVARLDAAIAKLADLPSRSVDLEENSCT